MIATVSNGLNVVNVNSYWQSLVIGLIILGAVGSTRSGGTEWALHYRASFAGVFDQVTARALMRTSCEPGGHGPR